MSPQSQSSMIPTRIEDQYTNTFQSNPVNEKKPILSIRMKDAVSSHQNDEDDEQSPININSSIKNYDHIQSSPDDAD